MGNCSSDSWNLLFTNGISNGGMVQIPVVQLEPTVSFESVKMEIEETPTVKLEQMGKIEEEPEEIVENLVKSEEIPKKTKNHQENDSDSDEEEDFKGFTRREILEGSLACLPRFFEGFYPGMVETFLVRNWDRKIEKL